MPKNTFLTPAQIERIKARQQEAFNKAVQAQGYNKKTTTAAEPSYDIYPKEKNFADNNPLDRGFSYNNAFPNNKEDNFKGVNPQALKEAKQVMKRLSRANSPTSVADNLSQSPRIPNSIVKKTKNSVSQ